MKFIYLSEMSSILVVFYLSLETELVLKLRSFGMLYFNHAMDTSAFECHSNNKHLLLLQLGAQVQN
jgi:hypothetical protein